jgi:hypothetical protein
MNNKDAEFYRNFQAGLPGTHAGTTRLWTYYRPSQNIEKFMVDGVIYSERSPAGRLYFAVPKSTKRLTSTTKFGGNVEVSSFVDLVRGIYCATGISSVEFNLWVNGSGKLKLLPSAIVYGGVTCENLKLIIRQYCTMRQLALIRMGSFLPQLETSKDFIAFCNMLSPPLPPAEPEVFLNFDEVFVANNFYDLDGANFVQRAQPDLSSGEVIVNDFELAADCLLDQFLTPDEKKRAYTDKVFHAYLLSAPLKELNNLERYVNVYYREPEPKPECAFNFESNVLSSESEPKCAREELALIFDDFFEFNVLSSEPVWDFSAIPEPKRARKEPEPEFLWFL